MKKNENLFNLIRYLFNEDCRQPMANGYGRFSYLKWKHWIVALSVILKGHIKKE